MNLKETIINIIAIVLIVVLPHTGIFPNFIYSIPILLFVWFALKSSNQTFYDIGFSFKRFKPKSILIGSIIAILTLSFMQLIFFPILEHFVTFKETDVDLYNFLKENRGQYFFILIMGFLIGGIYEEIVFHGFIFSSLEKIFKGKYATKISFFLTAVLFGIYHIQLGIDGLINALLVGTVYLTLFLYFKRNLWYSIFCHGIYNTIVITMIYHGYL
ncbi:CPBP family intramembrane glutamic endopeptidase [Pseudotenacibaculum sp. MALMAid0570]|uniref:CPBP family intramembrane glutamic endopeptidase n=1 Tax=Pseudotenacibaculum sp. MALMAid0570 TaxID=3143938 RepID=UPI0032DF4C48